MRSGLILRTYEMKQARGYGEYGLRMRHDTMERSKIYDSKHIGGDAYAIDSKVWS